MKQAIIFLGFLFAFGIGVFITWQFSRPAERQVIEQSTVVLERVRKVLKMVTIEGEYAETYKGGDIRNLTFYLPFPTNVPAPKQAIVQVTGKVLVGFDMNRMEIKMDEATKVLTISNLPEPEIISIDHELSYYNIEQSWFNTFTPADYTKLNKDAKEKIREAALKGNLLEQAQQQGNQLIEVIKTLAETSGWTVQYKDGKGNIISIDQLLG